MKSSSVPIVSADSHVNEPPELWRERLPKEFRRRAPHREVRDGVEYLIVEGTRPRKMAGGRIKLEGEDMERSHAGGWNPERRMADQDRDGVTGEVIYPSNGLGIFVSPDPAYQMAMARTYNDWAHEVFGAYAQRFAPAALVPTADIDLAIGEAQRVAKTGLRCLFMPAQAPAMPYNDARYDRLWAAVQETGLTINFHCGTGHEPRAERGPGGAVINYLLHAQGDGPQVICYFAASGILDRFPRLHIVTVETGSAWLAWVVQSMDQIYRQHHMWVQPKLSLLPSELVRRQAHATFQDDPVGVRNRSVTGVEPLLWGSDYPHHEGTWPHSQEAIARMFAGVPEDEKRKIVGGTAATLYGF